jgi:preprotein translocase subunit YajC
VIGWLVPAAKFSLGGFVVVLLAHLAPWWLLAEAENANQGQGSLLSVLPAILAIVALFYFMMLRPERRRQQQHRALLESLKKNDRVVTVGGVYGVVTNVQRDADEVTIKVDEATNTKLRVTFGSISRVIADEPAGDKPAKT